MRVPSALAVVLVAIITLLGSTDGRCTTDPGTALYEVAYHCVGTALRDGGDDGVPDIDLLNSTHWNSYCSRTEGVYECLAEAFKDCEEGYTDLMYSAFLQQLSYRQQLIGNQGGQQICDGDKPSQEFIDMFEAADQLVCMTSESRTSFGDCIRDWREELSQYRHANPLSSQDVDLLKRWALSTFQCVLAPVRALAVCGPAVEELLIQIVNATVPDHLRDDITREEIAQAAGSGAGLTTRRSTVGVFGDPHLQLYSPGGSTPRLMTCSAPQWRDYIRNKYIVIRGRNVPVSANSRATTLREVLIQFHDQSSSPIVTQYNAEGGDLPLTFTSGVNDAAGGKLSVFKVRYNKVRIIHRGLGHVIFLRSWGPHYFFTIRMADVLLDVSSGLLISGCTRAEQISSSLPPVARRRRAATSSDCDAACSNITRQGGLDFKSTCLFDCLEMGDTQAAAMTSGFLEASQVAADFDSELPLTDNPDNEDDDGENTSRPTVKDDDDNNKSGANNVISGSLWTILMCICVVRIKQF